MINFQNRSQKKELLDAEGIPFADIKKNMQELDTINRLLGGHAITIKGIHSFLNPTPAKVSVCEIGCGGGDNLSAIKKFCDKRHIIIKLTGIDIKKECTDYAAERNQHMDANWICSDYKFADFSSNQPDIIFSSLFCHHFTKEELVEMLKWMKKNCRLGFFINDLHRHPFAYYSIKWITKLFSGSSLVKNDAPLSVARGFIKKDWEEIFIAAGINNYNIQWKWAFRYLIVYKK